MEKIDLWEESKLIPGITEGEFTEEDIKKHNDRITWRYNLLNPAPKPEKEDDSNWTKTRIREEVKKLKDQSYELQQYIVKFKQLPDGEYFYGGFEKDHQILCKRIKDYEFRLRDVPMANTGTFTPDVIARANESPIQDYYRGGKLRRSGKTLIGICPFHQEKTGSFVIYADKNNFFCFGCLEKGDVIDFISKTEKLNFNQAIKYLLKL